MCFITHIAYIFLTLRVLYSFTFLFVFFNLFFIYTYVMYIFFPLGIRTYDKAKFHGSRSFYSEKIVLKSKLKKKTPLLTQLLTLNNVKIYTHRVHQVFHQSVENVSVCSKLGGLYCFLRCALLKRKKTVVVISRRWHQSKKGHHLPSGIYWYQNGPRSLPTITIQSLYIIWWTYNLSSFILNVLDWQMWSFSEVSFLSCCVGKKRNKGLF